MLITSIKSKYWKGDQTFLKELIKTESSTCKEYDGCLWNIPFPNQPLFIAHMDTVSSCDDSKPLRLKNGKIRRQGSALGADDRAGINLIMNHHKQINWLFTRDEETGREGATAISIHKEFLLDLEKVSCIIQLDCTGHKIVRGSLHGYCNDDLMTDLKKVIPEIKDSHGSFSDLDEFIHIKPGINLSIGYYKQHTKQEYLDITQYNYVNSIILKLSKNLVDTYTIVKPKLTYHYSPKKGNNKRYWTNDDEKIASYPTYKPSKEYKRCSSCRGSTETTYIAKARMFLCQDCIDDLLDELINIGGADFENQKCITV